MTDEIVIRIPREYVNDGTVKFLRWLVKEGQEVTEGEPLAELETSKAVVELAAPACGKVWQRATPGAELRVGEIVACISNDAEASQQVEASLARTASGQGQSGNGSRQEFPASTHFSARALELLETHGLARSLFVGRGLVRERDVLAHIEQAQHRQHLKADVHFALDEIPLEGLSLPAGLYDRDRGKVDPEFLARLQREPDSLAGLCSAEKCQAYRRHGAEIGDGVLLGARSIVISRQIVLGARVQIGPDSWIECRERFLAGQLTSFRSRLSVRGGTVVFGDNVFGGANVQIGGGGHGDPHSLLCVGDNTYIGDDAFLNICRPILVGKEAYVTQRSILVTHNIGHSLLEGYENRFAPIVVEDCAQIGMSSVIYAGSRIGNASIIMSNSYVISSIPAGKIAGGVPARVVREARREVDGKRQIEMAHEMVREFHELLTRKGYRLPCLGNDPGPSFTVQWHDKLFQLLFLERDAAATAAGNASDEFVLWTFEPYLGSSQPGLTVMNLLARTCAGGGGIFAETSREFLRKRGIRLEPGPWRYSGGLI